MCGHGDQTDLRLQSEFASVQVRIDHSANGPRLRITDRRSGQVGFLDPLELESLAWSRHEDLERLLDPNRQFGDDRDTSNTVSGQHP